MRKWNWSLIASVNCLVFFLLPHYGDAGFLVSKDDNHQAKASIADDDAVVVNGGMMDVLLVETKQKEDLEKELFQEPIIGREGILLPEVPAESHRTILLNNTEKHLVYGTQTGRLILAGVMGACIGLFSGFLLTVLGCCCYLKFKSGSLEFDKHNNTYRSADLIDGLV